MATNQAFHAAVVPAAPFGPFHRGWLTWRSTVFSRLEDREDQIALGLPRDVEVVECDGVGVHVDLDDDVAVHVEAPRHLRRPGDGPGQPGGAAHGGEFGAQGPSREHLGDTVRAAWWLGHPWRPRRRLRQGRCRDRARQEAVSDLPGGLRS